MNNNGRENPIVLDNTPENVGKERNITGDRVPPDPPTTLPVRNNGEAFGIARHYVAEHMEIKLSIEFPLKNGLKVNDVALFFKRFITIFFAVDNDIYLLTQKEVEYGGGDMLIAPPVKKKAAFSRLVLGKEKESARGAAPFK